MYQIDMQVGKFLENIKRADQNKAVCSILSCAFTHLVESA